MGYMVADNLDQANRESLCPFDLVVGIVKHNVFHHGVKGVRVDMA